MKIIDERGTQNLKKKQTNKERQKYAKEWRKLK